MIGKWVARSNYSLAHHVESEIEDRKVMHCGRQMKTVTKDGQLRIVPDTFTSKCHQCKERLLSP